MKKKQLKILTTISIVIFILIQSSPLLSQSVEKNSDAILVIKNSEGKSIKSMNLSFDDISLLIKNMKLLLNQLENNTISEKEFLQSLLILFIQENIISKSCTLDNLKEVANAFSQKIKAPNLLNINSLNSFNLSDNNNGVPIHFGRSTIIGSISFGNFLVKRIIPFGKYGFYEVFSKNIILDYNLSSDFTYASACIWTPGPHGYHILYSFMHYPGLERLSHKAFIDKAIGGLFVVGANISLEAYSTEGNEVLFDATIGVYGSDIMFGFK